MRNLPTYDQYIILERNKTVDYFRNNPDMLKNKYIGFDAHKNKWENPEVRNRGQVGTWDDTQKLWNKIQPSFMKLSGWTTEFTVRNRTVSVGKWIEDAFTARNYDGEKFVKAIVEAKSADDLAKMLRDRYYMQIEYSKYIDEIPELWDFIKANFSLITQKARYAQKAMAGLYDREYKRFQNQMMKLGLSINDVAKAMSWVQEWTSMSRKRLPKEVWPMLRDISVSTTLLPKYVYRGIFYDGAKIKDEKKFLDQWSPGNKPGVSQGKATSWSVDRGTAASFMTDQDFIKDSKRGYYVLLKWKVDPQYVIADLRNLPVDHTFWNQQEIIVDPAAKDYEIDTIIPGAEGYDGLKKFQQTIKSGAGHWGQPKKDFIKNLIFTPFDEIETNQKIQWKQIMYMTFGEARSKFGVGSNWNEEWTKKIENAPFPLAQYMERLNRGAGFAVYPVATLPDGSIEFEVSIPANRWEYESIWGPEIKGQYKAMIDNYGINPWSIQNEIVGRGKATLINRGFYDIDIKIDLPAKYDLVMPEGKKNRDEKVDKAVAEFFAATGSALWKQGVERELRDHSNNLSTNIQVKIK